MVIDITMNYSSGESRDVVERPAEYANLVEESLLFKASPARLASIFGLDKTLEWETKRTEGPSGSTANGSLLKMHSS
jgi:hypothetical protein